MNVNFILCRESQQFHLYSILKPIPNVTQRQRFYLVERFVVVTTTADAVVAVVVVVPVFVVVFSQNIFSSL